jgi:L-alanine-DL-glutamate epimerase-like enolase superfamily enzyme
MKIESVDAFYLRQPEVQDIGDGSQDALLVRIRAGGLEGWGECEASPLPTIAALVTPMSHSACHPVSRAVIGAKLEGPQSIADIHEQVRSKCMDLLQADHALSGIDIALWDLLGKREKSPVWAFFGETNCPKTAYASQLFGNTPEQTFQCARALRSSYFRAAKFGWGPIGTGSIQGDRDQILAAREGLGPNIALLVDTGCIFDHDVERAKERLRIFEEFEVGWWEEPFMSGALAEYRALSQFTEIGLAGGEGAHNADQAKHFIDYGGVRFIQIDTGRVGGISAAREVARYARDRGVAYVNHTFTSNLALSASLQPYADMSGYAELPLQTSALARAIAGDPWAPNDDGLIRAANTPGLGVDIQPQKLEPFLQDLEISWQGKSLYKTPRF